jgi:hypothetical protein
VTGSPIQESELAVIGVKECLQIVAHDGASRRAGDFREASARERRGRANKRQALRERRLSPSNGSDQSCSNPLIAALLAKHAPLSKTFVSSAGAAAENQRKLEISAAIFAHLCFE